VTVVESTITRVYRATAAGANVQSVSVSGGEDGQEPSVWRLPALVHPPVAQPLPHPTPICDCTKITFLLCVLVTLAVSNQQHMVLER
jgi:hypothetical protein